MHRVGVGGAEIFNVSESIPPGNAPFMSDNWHQMIAHATREADRLNLELCIHNCAGWSSSGGPWVTPDHAMQFLTTSQIHIHGPAHFSAQLPQPATKLDFYRDIAVLAFPSSGDAGSLSSYSPKVTTNVDGIDLSNLINNNQITPIRLPKPTADKHDYITIELSRPMKVETATIALGRPRIDVAGQLLSSDDGQSFQTVQKFHVSRTGARSITIGLADHPPTARFYRFVFMSSSAAQFSLPGSISVLSASLTTSARKPAMVSIFFSRNRTIRNLPPMRCTSRTCTISRPIFPPTARSPGTRRKAIGRSIASATRRRACRIIRRRRKVWVSNATSSARRRSMRIGTRSWTRSWPTPAGPSPCAIA